jgi:hypothetical protein
MMNPFQSIVIIQAPSVSQKISDEIQDEAHSNQVSLSMGTGNRLQRRTSELNMWEKKNKWHTSLQNRFHGRSLSIFARD